MWLDQDPRWKAFLEEHERTRLNNAAARKRREMDDVYALSADQARTVLVALCNDERIRRDAVYLSRKLQRSAGAQPTQDVESGGRSSKSLICVQCNEVYNPEENSGRLDCRYHPGFFALNFDDGFWDDDDRDERAIDTIQDREEFPEGFKWTCCGRVGHVKGCCMGPHEPDPCKSKKRGKFGFQEGAVRPAEDAKEYEEDENYDDEDEDDEEPEVQVLGERPCNKRKAEDAGGTDSSAGKKGAWWTWPGNLWFNS